MLFACASPSPCNLAPRNFPAHYTLLTASGCEAARTHSIPEPTIHVMEQFATSTITDESQREKELLRSIGNSIPVLNLRDVVEHLLLLSLLSW